MFGLRIGKWVAILCLFIPLSFSYSEEVYRWTDEKGGVHLTDDLSKVPDRYRSQVEKREMTEELFKENEKRILPERSHKDSAPVTEPQVKPPKKQDRVKEYLEAIEEKIERKRTIEKRISELQEEMHTANERIKQLEKDEQENYPLMQPYGSGRKFVPVESPHYREKVKLTNRTKEIKDELTILEQRLDDIKRSL